VINELISNALTHGLSVEGGRVEIASCLADGVVTVDIRDDGPTHPPSPTVHSSGLGLQIIETLVHEDLGGSFQLVREEGGEWMCARVRFPQRVANEEN
jgi:two-component sensor histidine kinase